MATLNPAVFVVGCPRSGTTLLQRMLDAHPQLAVANDTHFIPIGVPEWRPGDPDPTLTCDAVEAIRGYRRWPRLGLSEARLEEAASASATYGGLVGRLYDALAKQQSKPRSGEKTPDYVRHLPLLHTLCPNARVIHIIRDGRDVALSARDWATGTKGPAKFGLWEEEPVAVTALWWRWQVATGLRDGPRLGGQTYREVRYERLVESPEATLRSLAELLDLPFDPAMVDFHEGRTKDDPRLSAKSAWLPATAGLRDWRSQMSERDVALFEALVGPCLEDAGYERACSSIPPEVEALAERCRWWWERAAGRRYRGHSGEGAQTLFPPAYRGGPIAVPVA